jgi:thiol-disulfide isomerase/thioredoxin
MNIHDVDADYTVLVFWEPTCSHCKKAIPKLHTIYKNELKDQNVKVLAVCTQFGEDGKEKWVDFVNNHQLYDWINAWNPYDYKYKVVYDIRSTPQIYVLNKDKEIIGKKLGPENVPELIEAYKKIKKKE